MSAVNPRIVATDRRAFVTDPRLRSRRGSVLPRSDQDAIPAPVCAPRRQRFRPVNNRNPHHAREEQWLAGVDDLLIGSRTATSGSPRDPSQYPHALLGSRRLFKIAHLNDSPTQIVMIDLADSRLNMELTFNRGVSHGAACLKVAHAFVGVHNEHFLHNRSRGRGDHSCRILGSAPLNSAF